MEERDHGGGLAAAAAAYGGAPGDWLDLSTGINPRPYPPPPIPLAAWARLPDRDRLAALGAAARAAYGVHEAADIVAGGGAQALIQILPRIAAPGRVVIVAPTYNEHAAAFRAAGWRVEERAEAAPADAVVIVNPNNPDGRVHGPEALAALERRSGLVIVDESFADAEPGISRVGAAPRDRVVLRSFGKFYGLAGLRLGFAIAAPEIAGRLLEALGPWAVSGAAIEIGVKALGDGAWRAATRARLAKDAARLDGLLSSAGFEIVGGTRLFRLAAHDAAPARHVALARAHIWTRAFSHSPRWLRFGLPGAAAEWARLERALRPWC